MISVTNTEKTEDYTSATMISGKHTVEIAVWNDGSVMVAHQNASKTGKHFASFLEAYRAYKAKEIKSMIAFFESEMV